MRLKILACSTLLSPESNEDRAVCGLISPRREPVEPIQGFSEMSDCLCMGRAYRGLLPCQIQISDRPHSIVGLGPMAREHFGVDVLKNWELLLDCTGNDPVDFLATTLQQCFVGGVANERVLELVMGVRRKA